MRLDLECGSRHTCLTTSALPGRRMNSDSHPQLLLRYRILRANNDKLNVFFFQLIELQKQVPRNFSQVFSGN